MNTALTVWSISAGDRHNRSSFTEELSDWCFSKSNITFQLYSCDEALSRITSTGERPDLILINSSRRGEFSRKMLQRVVGKYPLSLLLEITGEWCIGDTRSGNPLPIACRFDTTIACQRLQSLLASRQHFLQVRAALNPLASFAELSSYWNRDHLATHSKSINVIAADCSERQALRMLLHLEGFNAHFYPNVHAISQDNRHRPVVYCITDRRELETLFRATISSPAVIITNHFNGLDQTFFEEDRSVTLLRKPFLGHDLVNAISTICLLSTADAA